MLLKLSLFVLLILALEASAFSLRHHEHSRMKKPHRDLSDNEVKSVKNENTEIKLTKWHGKDKGYPEFDGNPFKKLIVDLTSMIMSSIVEAADKTELPPQIEQMLQLAAKTNWSNFDEYLDFWGNIVSFIISIDDDDDESREINQMKTAVKAFLPQSDDSDETSQAETKVQSLLSKSDETDILF